MDRSPNTMSHRSVWLSIGVVFVCILLVLFIVFNHDREKPRSPQEAVAAAFSQMFPINEWQPGMGKQPLMYHPAGFNSLTWKPLPQRGENRVWNNRYPTPTNQLQAR